MFSGLFGDQKQAGLLDEQKLETSLISEVIKVDFISPGILGVMGEAAILKLDKLLHEIYELEGVNQESIVNAHIFILEELERRGIDHPDLNDDLDQETEKLQADKSIYPTDLLPEYLIEEVSLGNLELVPFVVTENALCLTGSSVYGKEEPHDLDFLIRNTEKLETLEKAIADTFPRRKCHFLYEPKGPSWDYVPCGDFMVYPSRKDSKESISDITLNNLTPTILDDTFLLVSGIKDKTKFRVNSHQIDFGLRLKLERIFQDPGIDIVFSKKPLTSEEKVIGELVFMPKSDYQIVKIYEPEFRPFYSSKVRESILETAKAPPMEQAIKEIEFGQWFPPVKVGAFGYAGKEVFNIDDAWKLWGEPILAKGYKIIGEQKFDGVRLQWHIDQDKNTVSCFTEGSLEKKRKGINVADKLPEVVKDALSNLKCKNCVLDTETVLWEGDLPQRREEMTAIVARKESASGRDIRVNIFDIVWLDGEDLSDQGYLDRKKELKKVLPKNTEHFFYVDHEEVSNRDQFYKTYEKFSKETGSEGVMFKTANWEYTLKGKISWMTKVKKIFEIDVEIIGRRKVPASKPAGKKMTADQMNQILPDQLKRSNTWTFRCAFKGKSGKLQPFFADKRYSQGDLELKWDEERQKWKGTEDPEQWEMAKGFPNSEKGNLAYGNTYNFSSTEGGDPKLGDIITVAPALIRLWKDSQGEVQASWIFPRPRNLKPEKDQPDDYKVVNAVVSAVAQRHGKKPEILFEDELLNESKPRRDQCVECDKPPTVEVLWAEGMAHTWFCDDHFEEWKKRRMTIFDEEGENAL